jgi:hypothetical protein
LEYLNVPDQYPDLPPAPGKYYSRCTDRQLQSGIEITDPIIGFRGLCDLEMDPARGAKSKTVGEECEGWPVGPRDAVSDAILKTISMNLGRIMAGTNLNLQ